MSFINRRGFTLIELLIVVAIIAILAAIAVPNFLEAQTRAKVSRAKADMRSLATAIESYHIDHNQYAGPWEAFNAAHMYTWGSTAEPPFHSRTGSNMSTPISYMTSMPKDPFSVQEDFLNPGAWPNGSSKEISNRFAYWNFPFFRATPLTSTIFMAGNTAAGEWLLYSPGPDKDVANGGGSGSFYRPYDPTNGTVSLGNVFRTHGSSDGIDYARFLDLSGL
jgi:type II secretion system protein G